MFSNLNNERYFSNNRVPEQYFSCCEVIIYGTKTRLSAEIPTTAQSGLVESPASFPPKHCWSRRGSSLSSCQEIIRFGKRDSFSLAFLIT